MKKENLADKTFFKDKLPYLVIFFIYSAVFIFSYCLTEFPVYAKIPLLDGNQYLKMYHYFNDFDTHIDYKVNFPFNGRIIYILIASFFPDTINPIDTFIILNYLVGFAILCTLLYTWNKCLIPLYQSFFLLVYLCIHWSGLIRQYMVDPIGVDLPYLLFLSILMYLIVVDKYQYLFVIGALGTLVKEAILPFIVVLFFIKLINKKNIYFENKRLKFKFSTIDGEIKYIFIAIVVSIICKISINILFPPIQSGWKTSSVVVVMHFFYLALKEPYHILNWLTSVVLFFGVLLYPFIKGIITLNRDVDGKMYEVALLALLGIGLAILGGGDHTRIAFLSFPFVFTFLVLYFKSPAPYLYGAVYLIPSFYYTKCWKLIPTSTSNWDLYSSWYPEYTSYQLFLMDIIVFIASIIMIYFVEKRVVRIDAANS